MNYMRGHSILRLKSTLCSILLLACLSAHLYAQQPQSASSTPTADQTDKIYTPQNLPKVHLQNKFRYLCDPQGYISPTATDSIDRMLYRLEQQTGIETVVAVVPSIGDNTCFDFCHELLNSWGVGKKGKDNGLVILLVIDQRCIQFYTGYGLEGPLPDAICKRIQTQAMLPYLKEERWSEGMVSGVQATCARLADSMENDSQAEESSARVWLMPIILLIVLVLAAIGRQRLRNRCPYCKQAKLQRTNSKTLSFHNGYKTEEVTYVCRNCGRITIRRERHNSNRNNGNDGGWGGPVIFGGGFGGGGGGGNFGGGSFGGGSGGGGGAGSNF